MRWWNNRSLHLVEAVLAMIVSGICATTLFGWPPFIAGWVESAIPYIALGALIYGAFRIGVPFSQRLVELHRQGR